MKYVVIFLIPITVACHSKQSPFEKVLRSGSEKISKVISDPEKFEVQILFTEVIKDDEGNTSFVDESFQVDDETYFYPASSVKFPAAILALEKLNEMKTIDRNTPFQVDGDSINTTIANEIIEIFAISDNEAYNRLFEFIGKDDFNERLHSRGIDTRISHRLSVGNADDLISRPVMFAVADSTLTIPERTNKELRSLQLKKAIKGKGYMVGDSLVSEPKDFSKKNYLPVTSLHNIMKRILFPELFSKEERFKISKEDRSFLIEAMKKVPQESGYDATKFYDGYVKFFVLGDHKDKKPTHIDIYNKVGYAYGYLTDCAYIKNSKTNKEYIITATLHVNENQIFNDDNYEYDDIGIPFLAELGRQLVLK